jgi:hypothetical protein
MGLERERSDRGSPARDAAPARFPRGALLLVALAAALAVVALLRAPPAAGAVIDDIAIERHDSTARVRLRLTGSVHYLHHTISADGEVAHIFLQALAPEAFAGSPFPDEVKHSRGSAGIPGFTVRVSLDPRCEPTPNPVCIVVQFERPVRYEVRLGEDRRSVTLDFPLASDGEGDLPAAREKP